MTNLRYDNNEQNENVIFVTFYCKWCKRYMSQSISLEDFNMMIHCFWCNNYGISLSNDKGSRELFRDGIDGKYFGGYDRKALNESYGGDRNRLIAERGIKHK